MTYCACGHTDVLEHHVCPVTYAKLETENAELKKKLAVAESSIEHEIITGHIIGHIKDRETIESLNLRVARLVDALKFYADGSHFIPTDDCDWENVSGEPPNFLENDLDDGRGGATVEDGSIAKQALSAESDNQWLREHDIAILKEAADVVKFAAGGFCGGHFETVMHTCANTISELRNPSLESDIDREMRDR